MAGVGSGGGSPPRRGMALRCRAPRLCQVCDAWMPHVLRLVLILVRVFRTENSRHWPGSPFRGRIPRPSNPMPEPTRSLTVPGSEHLGWSGGGCQPGAYMHGHADELVVQDLPRVGVNADAYLDSQRLYGVNDRLGDAQRPRWAVEGGQEAVAGAVDLAAAEPGQFRGGSAGGARTRGPAICSHRGGWRAR